MSAQSASLCPSVVARGVCILPCDVTVKTHLSKTTKSNRHANQSCTEQSLSSSLPVRNQPQRRFHCFSLSLQINRSWTSMKKVLKVVTFNQKHRENCQPTVHFLASLSVFGLFWATTWMCWFSLIKQLFSVKKLAATCWTKLGMSWRVGYFRSWWRQIQS